MIIAQTNRGFTLIETIIYVALVGAIGTSFVLFVLSAGSNSGVITERSLAEAEWQFFWRTLERELGAAVAVLPASGSNASVLEISQPAGRLIVVSFHDDRLWLNDGGGEEVVLGKSFVVTGVEFINRGVGQRDSLEVAVDWRAPVSGAAATTNFIINNRGQ